MTAQTLRDPFLRRPSLARRLIVLAVGWSFAALAVAAVVLALLFQQASLRPKTCAIRSCAGHRWPAG